MKKKSWAGVDFTGQRFGKLLVLGFLPGEQPQYRCWNCRCDCGEVRAFSVSDLTCWKRISCGQCWRGKDRIGQRCGRLAILRHDPTDSRKWICRCDCGAEISVQGGALTPENKKATRSCGCLRFEVTGANGFTIPFAAQDDLTGRKFGSLTTLRRLGQKRGSHLWECRCDCGNLVQKRAVYLLKETTHRGGVHNRHCGCRAKELRLAGSIGKVRHTRTIIEAAVAHATRAYSNSAKKRSLSWELTDTDVARLIQGACHWCGVEPTGVFTSGWGETLETQGIDRVDNTTGYTISNTVPCCLICNRAKNNLTIERWLAWRRRFVAHAKPSKTRTKVTPPPQLHLFSEAS
jgi:hypothetical protein